MINTINIYIIYIGLPYELDAMTLDTLGEVCPQQCHVSIRQHAPAYVTYTDACRCQWVR